MEGAKGEDGEHSISVMNCLTFLSIESDLRSYLIIKNITIYYDNNPVTIINFVVIIITKDVPYLGCGSSSSSISLCKLFKTKCLSQGLTYQWHVTRDQPSLIVI